MGDIVIGICELAYSLWNTFVEYALKLFSLSPLDAGDGDLVGKVSPIYDGLLSVALSLVVLFCIIAVLRDAVTAPPGQQLHRLANSGVKYGLIIAVTSNLWTLMSYIIEFCDWVTSLTLNVKPEDLQISFTEDARQIVDTYYSNPPGFSIFDIGGSIIEILTWAMLSLVFVVLGIVSIFVFFASAISIINVAFQRIIKPLVIMPFAAIFVATGASSGDSERTMWNYLKMFIGFCLSGAFMVVCIRLGSALAGTPSLFQSFIDPSATDLASISKSMIFMFVQNAMAPIVVAGLVKSVDSIIQRIL